MARARQNRSWVRFPSLAALLALTQFPLFADEGRPPPGYVDPEQLALASRQRQLNVDRQNLTAARLSLHEFELKAHRITRELEALSAVTTNDIPPAMQGHATDLYRELQRLDVHIQKTCATLAADARLIEERSRQLDTQEAEYQNRVSRDRKPAARSPGDDYAEKIREQNERLKQEAAQHEERIALQNMRLMQEADIPPPPAPTLFDLLSPSTPATDQAQLRFCQALEQKVMDPNYDIAAINLSVAKGLPGTENLDVARTLKTLDLWATRVRHETDRHFYRFQKAPEEYNRSEAYFRILMMVCVLQEDFHVCYNKDPKMQAGPVELVPNDFSFFANPRDLFLCGVTEGEHQGTCASLPVLYVAIGRRLGYPLKLVECKGHLFVRWEDAKSRFNIEGTSRGLNCYPDEEYMEWPWPISKAELDTGMYMTPLSPRRELAAFLELRALCLKHHGRTAEHAAAKSYADDLRKKEGVDLDRLNELLRQALKQNVSVDIGNPSFLYQTLTNTNTWRQPRKERGDHDETATLSIDRNADR